MKEASSSHTHTTGMLCYSKGGEREDDGEKKEKFSEKDVAAGGPTSHAVLAVLRSFSPSSLVQHTHTHTTRTSTQDTARVSEAGGAGQVQEFASLPSSPFFFFPSVCLWSVVSS